MFSCYIRDAWKHCCLYGVLSLIIYFNDFSTLVQRIFVINNSLFQTITGDITPNLFFLKHILEARFRCIVPRDILVGSPYHVDRSRQSISSNLLSGWIDVVSFNYCGFACQCAEDASSVLFSSNLIGSFASGLDSGFLEKVESSWWIQSPSSD